MWLRQEVQQQKREAEGVCGEAEARVWRLVALAGLSATFTFCNSWVRAESCAMACVPRLTTILQ